MFEWVSGGLRGWRCNIWSAVAGWYNWQSASVWMSLPRLWPFVYIQGQSECASTQETRWRLWLGPADDVFLPSAKLWSQFLLKGCSCQASELYTFQKLPVWLRWSNLVSVTYLLLGHVIYLFIRIFFLWVCDSVFTLWVASFCHLACLKSCGGFPVTVYMSISLYRSCFFFIAWQRKFYFCLNFCGLFLPW